MGMPETTIGFVPGCRRDPAALALSPGETGTDAALTGAHLGGSDALSLGLADHFVPSERPRRLAAALETEELRRPPSGACAARRRLGAGRAAGMDRRVLFRDDAEEMCGGCGLPAGKRPRPRTRLRRSRPRREGGPVIPAQGKGLSLEEALEQEYRVGLRFLAGPDFREGIRAQVVDKDRNPRLAAGHPRRRSAVPTSKPISRRWGSRELQLSKERDNV